MNANFEIIEEYIDGELEGKELFEFEQLLSSNNGIKRDYDLSMNINHSIQEDDVMALRDTLKYMYANEADTKRMPHVFTKRRLYYAAASAALLIAAGGLIQRIAGPDLENSAVYEKYYTPYDVTVTYRSGNTEVDRILITALERYEERDYEHALVLFEEVLGNKKDDMALNLYTGISYMEEEKYQKATNSFNNIISNNNNLFIEQAKWYLAMCYVKTENDKKAKEVLHELIKDDSYYKDLASKVLKDLN